MNTSLATLVNQTLPAVSNSSVTYNADRNMFLTAGYTSAAGNTYFQGIHLSNRLAIVFDIGVGYAYTFLNGMKLYCFDHDHLMRILVDTIQNIPGIGKTETLVSLDQAIERQVWVKDYDYKKNGSKKRKA